MAEKCIYPLSPREQGHLFILAQGYKGVVVTDSSFEVAARSAFTYFSQRSEDELKDLELHPTLVERPDFIVGIIQMTKLIGRQDTAEAYYARFDEDPHHAEHQVSELEDQFRL